MSRTIIVTGAGSGIGAAIAKAFVEAGDRVFGCDVSRERIEETCGELGELATPLVVDVSDEHAIVAAIRGVAEKTGQLDVMVNSAGVGDGQPAFVDTTSELWHQVLGINLSGTFYACREAARLMLPQERGRIINVGSVSAFSGRANGVPYTVSKAGMFGLTQRMAYELGPHGITVNAVLPGSITTGIGATTPEILGETFPGVVQSRISDEALRALVPSGRRGRPEEVSAAVFFLASEAASYINGITVPVDGGWLAS